MYLNCYEKTAVYSKTMISGKALMDCQIQPAPI